MSSPTLERPDQWESLRRLDRDLRSASRLFGQEEARWLTDFYYQVQEFRKASKNQVRAAEDAPEPNAVLSWVFDSMRHLEDDIKKALGEFTDEYAVGRWMKCAPVGSLVMTANRLQVPIEHLGDGQSVLSFNRKKQSLTRPRPIKVAVNEFVGNLVSVGTGSHVTRTTPFHRWLVRMKRPAASEFCVYLMRRGGRFRVGKTLLFNNGKEGSNRFNIQQRMWREKAEAVWILRRFSTEYEAAIYEDVVAATYGFTQCLFEPLKNPSRLYNRARIDGVFYGLDAAEQLARAGRCLLDHGLFLSAPLMTRTIDGARNAGTYCLETPASNLMADIMELPVPTSRYGFMDWLPIREAGREYYAGPVYSLDVAQHHKYVQDGLVTCNSITGIGPVLSAGFLSHLDIRKARTVGHFWRFAGQDPSITWEKKTKRPWNARLKVLCYKTGDCFVKFQNHEEDYYGRMYLARKEYEARKNAAGEYRPLAWLSLAQKNFGQETDARRHYEAGQLPPARLHLRAMRYATKLFLSHLHHAMHVDFYGTVPPVPFSFEHSAEDHRHFVALPNFPWTGGGRKLTELLR